MQCCELQNSHQLWENNFSQNRCVFKLVCGRALPCWKRISATFSLVRTPVKRFCKVLRVFMYRSKSMVWSRVYKNPSLCIQKTAFMTLPAELVALNFFFKEKSWIMPFHWLFCLPFKVIDPCFIPGDNAWQKAFTISKSEPTSFRTVLW